MKKLTAALLILALALGLLPAALAEDVRVSFAAERFTYTTGESVDVVLRANRAPESDLTLTLQDGKKNTYTVVIPAGQTEGRLTMSTPLSAKGSTVNLLLVRGESYLRGNPFEAKVIANGVGMYTFSDVAYVAFVGKEITCKVRAANPDRLEKGTIITLRDQDGNVLETIEHNPGRTAYAFTYPTDESWMPGKTLSLWVEGRAQADATALMAVGFQGGKSIYGVRRDDNRIAFTMDAGSGGKNVPKILDILDQFGVKITFFMTGQFAASYPEYAKMIAERGHELGNHSWSHPEFTGLSNEQILSEVNRTRDLIFELTGQTTVLFRPPKGDMNARTRALLHAAGYEVIRWTHESYDSREGHSPERSLKFATKDIKAGSIILSHVNADWTVSVLPDILQFYQDNGWQVVKVSELLWDGETAVDEEGLQYQVAAQEQ